MGKAVGLFLLAIEALVLPSSAAAPLAGQLGTSEPFLFEGVLTSLTGARLTQIWPHHTAGASEEQPILWRSEGATYSIYEFASGPLRGAPVEVPLSSPSKTEEFDVSRSTVRRLAFLEGAEALIRTGAETRSVRSGSNATGVRCAIYDPDPTPTHEVPADPKALPAGPGWTASSAPGELAADCQADTLFLDRPGHLVAYGIDLLLESPERNQTIRTGTFDDIEPITGLSRPMTRILAVDFKSGPAHAEFLEPARVRLYAEGFSGLGALATPPAQGNLRWGDWIRSGSIDPLSVTGWFMFERHGVLTIGVQGSTAEEPRMPPEAIEPFGVGLWIGLMMAGGSLVLVVSAGLLFTRLHPSLVLRHPRRSRIHEIVRREPGVGTADVARVLGIPWTKVAYHVRVLERAGHVRVHRFGSQTALFLKEAIPPSGRDRLALLRRPSHRRILDALANQGSLDKSRLAAALGVTRQLVSRQLSLLERHGLVQSERLGKCRRYARGPDAELIPSADVDTRG